MIMLIEETVIFFKRRVFVVQSDIVSAQSVIEFGQGHITRHGWFESY